MIEPFLSNRIPQSSAIDPLRAAPDCTGLTSEVGAALRSMLLAALATALAAGPAQAQGRGTQQDSAVPRSAAPDQLDLDLPVADPAAVIATEQAFARAAQEQGQWTAYAEYAADDAIMFAPQAVRAQDWLRGRADPPQAVSWQTHEVWSSCDGSLAVTRGAWQQADDSVGYFTTVWAQQERRGAGYRWVLDQGDTLEEPLPAPGAVEETVADCPWTGSQGMSEADIEAIDAEALRGGATVAGSGWSADGTLAYRYAVQPSGARELEVFIVKDGRVQDALRSEVAAP
ncbi:MAG TPA: hypothetical protein VI168_15085 [Croceibacterium sp.]